MTGQKLLGTHRVIREAIQHVSRLSSTCRFMSYLCFVGTKLSRKLRPKLSLFLSLSDEDKRPSPSRPALSPHPCSLLISGFLSGKEFALRGHCQYLETFLCSLGDSPQQQRIICSKCWYCWEWKPWCRLHFPGLRLHCSVVAGKTALWLIRHTEIRVERTEDTGLRLKVRRIRRQLA